MAAHHNMKSSQSPSRRSIQQAPSRDLQQWHDSTTKSAIPQRVTTYSVIYALLNCFHVICFLGKSSIHCCIQDQGYIQNHFPQVNARGSDFSEIVPLWPTRIQTERQRLGHTGVWSPKTFVKVQRLHAVRRGQLMLPQLTQVQLPPLRALTP